LVHVYLAFDNVGIDKTRWASEVQRLNQGSTAIDPLTGIRYKADPAKVQTFSFHPDSVRTGDTSLNRFWTTSTEGSYVAYNDRADTDPFDLRNTAGAEVETHPVLTQSTEDQIRLYKAAIASRNINNYHPETFHPSLYAFTRFNCGSWAQYMLETNGFAYPLEFQRGGMTNFGAGTDFHMGKPMRDFTDFYDAGFEFFETTFSLFQNMGASIDILEQKLSKTNNSKPKP
jgi:hypothetical protein